MGEMCCPWCCCMALCQADIASLEKEVKLLRGQSNLLSREVSKKETTTEKQKGAAAEKERLLAEKLEEVQEQAQAIQTLQVPMPCPPPNPKPGPEPRPLLPRTFLLLTLRTHSGALRCFWP